MCCFQILKILIMSRDIAKKPENFTINGCKLTHKCNLIIKKRHIIADIILTFRSQGSSSAFKFNSKFTDLYIGQTTNVTRIQSEMN